jgi:Rrf2 family protein
MGAPSAFLGKVLQRLKRAGLLEGARGAHGGYSLAGSPDEITIRDVVEAMEGKMSLSVCLSPEDSKGAKSCPRKRNCAARQLWTRLEGRLNKALESETIGRIARGRARPSEKRRTCGTTRKR